MIQYTHANASHAKFMVDRILSQEDGPRTHSVFADNEGADEEEPAEEEEGDAPK